MVIVASWVTANESAPAACIIVSVSCLWKYAIVKLAVDLRLGTCDPYLPCSTCGLNWIDCPGHFGHTELSDYVFHYGFLKHLKSLLQCICLKCSNILFEKEDDTLIKFKNKSSKNRFTEIKNLTKNISFCWNCGTPVPKIKKEIKENSASIRISLEREVGTVSVDEKTGDSSEMRKKIKEYLSPRECYNILRNISDTDCFLLGLFASIGDHISVNSV